MGMFDDVLYEADCPFCGHELRGWQSKDGECDLAKLTPKQLAEQANPGIEYGEVTFYTSCDECGTWVDVRMIRRW